MLISNAEPAGPPPTVMLAAPEEWIQVGIRLADSPRPRWKSLRRWRLWRRAGLGLGFQLDDRDSLDSLSPIASTRDAWSNGRGPPWPDIVEPKDGLLRCTNLLLNI